MPSNTVIVSDRRFWFGVWSTVLVAFGLLDCWRMLRGDGSTFCGFIRWAFHTHTPMGKAAFIGALIALARHILHP